jgi:hypothetical protein
MTQTLNQRKFEEKNIPEHLIRPPIDPAFQASLNKRKTGLHSPSMDDSKSQGGKRKTIRQQKLEKEEKKQMAQEMKKVRRADKNMRVFFSEVKKLLDKNEEDQITLEVNATVSEGKIAVQEKKFIRFLYGAMLEMQASNNLMV